MRNDNFTTGRRTALPSNIVTVLLGVLSGVAIVVSAFHGRKWLAASAMGVISFFSFFVVIREYKRCLLFLTVFFIPIRLDFFLIYKVTNYAQLTGLPVTIFDVFFVVLLGMWLFQLICKEETFNFFPSISIPTLLYVALAGLSALWSQDLQLSLSMAILIAKSYLIFIYFANNIKSREDVLFVVSALAMGVFLQSVIGILQFITGGTFGLQIFGEGAKAFETTTAGSTVLSRVGGTIGSANSLAMYLNFVLSMLLCVLFTKTRGIFRLAIFAILMSGFFTELLTLSRGGWIALTLSLFISIFGLLRSLLNSSLKASALMIVAVALLGTMTIIAVPSVRERIFEDDHGSAYSRIPMMKVAVNMIESNPIRGVGLNNYTTEMNKYDRSRENVSYRFPYPVHNAYLIIGAESGLAALAVFLLVLYRAFKMALICFQGKDNLYSPIGIGVFAGVCSWGVHAMIKMDFAGINPALWFAFGMIAALHALIVEDCAAKESLPLC